MKFGKSILSPSYSRKNAFDSVLNFDEKFSFKCSNCENFIEIKFNLLIGKDFSWHSDYDEDTYDQITKFYDMNSVGKSPDGGQTAVLKTKCANCQTEFFIYAGINEYYNSAYKITLQGITEILDDLNK